MFSGLGPSELVCASKFVTLRPFLVTNVGTAAVSGILPRPPPPPPLNSARILVGILCHCTGPKFSLASVQEVKAKCTITGQTTKTAAPMEAPSTASALSAFLVSPLICSYSSPLFNSLRRLDSGSFQGRPSHTSSTCWAKAISRANCACCSRFAA